MVTSISSTHIGTIAGTGEPGFSGEGGLSTKALVNEPKNVFFDQQGHLYVIDSENHVIRKIDRTSGLIHPFAGCLVESQQANVSPALPEDAAPAEPEDLLADLSDNPAGAYEHSPDIGGTVRYWGGSAPTESRFEGDGGKAEQARLNFPSGMVIDKAGVVYIADTLNHRIRRIDPASGLIHTIAGTGKARMTGDGGPADLASLNEPTALVIDGNGKLYVADQSNNRIRMIDTTTGIITTIAGDGEATYNGDGMPAIESGLAGPSGMAFDADGHLIIADTFNSRIRKVNLETGLIETILGNGQAFSYQPGVNEGELSVARPYGIAFDQNGHLLVPDSDNHLLRKWDPQENTMTLVAGNGLAQFSGDGDVPKNSSLNYPFGVAVDHEGNVAIADTFNHRIRFIAV